LLIYPQRRNGIRRGSTGTIGVGAEKQMELTARFYRKYTDLPDVVRRYINLCRAWTRICVRGRHAELDPRHIHSAASVGSLPCSLHIKPSLPARIRERTA
jgi:hypothetical protein